MSRTKSNPSLRALINRYSKSDVIAEMEKEFQSSPTRNVPLALIDDNRFLRKISYRSSSIRDIASSLQEKGFFSPLFVRTKGTHYELVLGRKRYLGAKKAAFEAVPCVIKDISDEEALLSLLADSRDRKDVNVVEMAVIYEALYRQYGYSQSTLAKLSYFSRSQVTNMLRLLSLPENVLEEVMKEKISYGHARALLPLSEKDIGDCLDLIHKEGLSVRETERLVNRKLYGGNESLKASVLKKKFGAREILIKKKSITFLFASEEEKEAFLQEEKE